MLIWYLIIVFTMIIVLSIYIDDRLSNIKTGFGDIVIEIIRPLLKQSDGQVINKTMLFNIWSFATLILTSCFIGAILHSILTRKDHRIDSLDDLFRSNLSAVDHIDSWLWWQYKNQIRWNTTLEKTLIDLKPRLLIKTNDEIDNDKVSGHSILVWNYEFARVSILDDQAHFCKKYMKV